MSMPQSKLAQLWVSGMDELTQLHRQLNQKVDREKAAEQQKLLNQPVGPRLGIRSNSSSRKDDNFEMASKQLRELFRSPQVGIILSPAKTNLEIGCGRSDGLLADQRRSRRFRQ